MGKLPHIVCVELLFTPYNGEPCAVPGSYAIPGQTDASSTPLTTNDNVPTDFYSNMSTPQNHGSTISPPAGNIETNPSSANGTPTSALQGHTSTTPAGGPKSLEEGYKVATPSGQPFQCPNCPQNRNSSALLNRHIKSHTRPYSCGFPGCRARKSEQRDLDHHQDTHGKIRLYFCPKAGCPWDANGPECGFSRRLGNAKTHLKSHDNHQDMSVLREDSQGRLFRV